MADLPMSLISEFVKITNDDKRTKAAETTVYGTIVEDSGIKFVKMDGAEVLTPIKTTVTAKNGDRVMVMIKNHNAVVTGNLSYPSARDIDIEDLGRQIAEFEVVLADKVDTKDLKAINAAIETLNATDVRIKGKLEAVDADIERIEANTITADEVNAQAVTAVKAALQEITAEDIETDELYASVAHIFKLAASNIEADKITTDELAAALVNITLANIDRANINYAKIVDAYANRIFTDSAIAGKIRAENLEITQAQIVDLIVGSFRLVDAEGKVYKVTVDKDGNLNTEYLYDQAEWMENGEIPDGYSAVADNLTVGDITAGNLYVAGAADVMKLTAKWLSADEAWINELTVGLIQAKLGEKLNLYSNSAIVGIVNDMTEVNANIATVESRFEQTSESFTLELNKKVGDADLRKYLRYEDGTVELGSSDSRYVLRANDTGVSILQDGEVMTRMEQNTVAAPVFEAGRMLKIGEHIAKISASGALVFN